MRLTKKMQIAIMTCLYLARAGKATQATLFETFKVDLTVLKETLHALEVAGIVGGSDEYSLNGNPTVADAIKAVSHKSTLTAKEYSSYRLGQHEQRALALFADMLTTTLNPLFNRTIRGIGNDLILAELAKMDSAKESGAAN